MENNFSENGLRIDDLHRNGYKIIQKPDNFCFGIDAVLLSAFCRIDKGSRVIDLGCGTGIIPILLAARNEGIHITGIDIFQENIELAEKSVALNNLNDRVSVLQADIKDCRTRFEAASFDAVTVNPPYMEPDGGLKNERLIVSAARHELLVTLSDIITAARWLLKFSGKLFMIHRPHRIADLFALLRENKLEPKQIRFVHPFIDKPPTMVLIEAAYGGKPMLSVMPPLIIYEKTGVYTKETTDIYYT